MMMAESRVAPKILFLVTEDHSFWTRRLVLARKLRDLGAEVWVITRTQRLAEDIQREGFKMVSWRVSRKSLNPFREIHSFLQVLAAYRRIQPDLVHHFSMKAIIYGGIAARLCGEVRSVNTVPGLGHAFTSNAKTMQVLRSLLLLFLRLSLKRKNAKTIFQNFDNRDVLVRGGAVESKQSVVIRGSGVDCAEFFPLPEPCGIPIVLLAGRMLWEKGVAEFIEAARILRRDKVSARFVLVGEPDPAHTSSISVSRLREWVNAGEVEWWGQQEDMPRVFAKASLVCLPSHGEGVPKTLIEAAACGRAMVATDVPGCREIVLHGENGLLVPVRDHAALARALATLINNPRLRARMAARGREIAAREFSKELVLRQTLDVYRELMPEFFDARASRLELEPEEIKRARA
jgi:glycosyltransferase involved in cell wall biosynthesis